MSRFMTKPTKWHYRLANTQISLGICPVWSDFDVHMKKAWVLIATHWSHSEDSDQTGRMPKLTCRHWAHSRFDGFDMGQLKLKLLKS